MNRTFWISASLAAALLTPTRAWEASVSQNIAVAIVKETIGLSPTSIAFSPQPTGVPSAAQTVTVSNTGAMAFPFSGVGLAGNNAADFAETNNCPTSLAVSASCLVSVTFAPATVGAMTASVVVSGPGGGTYTVALSGTAVSLTGTTIPSATAVGDASGNVWTVSGGQIYRNGVVDPITGGVALLLYYNGTIYQQTGSGAWYQLTSMSWPAGSTGWTYLSSGDPRTPSASGTTVPSATAITDASHNVYTVAGGQIYRNGIIDPVTAKVTLLLYYNGTIYQQTSSGVWYQLTSTSWPAGSNGWTYLASGDPRSAADPPCTGVAVSPASGIQNAVNANPAGTTFCLAAGTYYESIVPKSGDTFIGVGMSQTILNGQTNLSEGFNGQSNNSSNVTITGMTIENFTDQGVNLSTGGNTGWTLNYVELAFNHDGILMGRNTTFQNSFIHDTVYHPMHLVGSGNALSNNLITNNDIYNNNTSHTSPFGATADAGLKFNGGGGDTFSNNKIHDNYGNGLWFDSNNEGETITNNEIYNIGPGAGIAFEITAQTGAIIHHVSGNYIHDCASGQNCDGIDFADAGWGNVQGNAFSNLNNYIALIDEGNRGGDLYSGNPLINNDITISGNWFAVPPGQYGIHSADGGYQNWKAQNNIINGNTYYLVSSGQTAWYDDGNALNFRQWQAEGWDASGSVNANGATLPTGVGPRGGYSGNGP